MSRFSGRQEAGAKRNYLAQRAKDAADRQRQERMRDETRTPTSKHVWVPSSIDFSCVCNNDGCVAIWAPDEAHAPKTLCPVKRSENT
jgi:hypothetical protein